MADSIGPACVCRASQDVLSFRQRVDVVQTHHVYNRMLEQTQPWLVTIWRQSVRQLPTLDNLIEFSPHEDIPSVLPSQADSVIQIR